MVLFCFTVNEYIRLEDKSIRLEVEENVSRYETKDYGWGYSWSNKRSS